MELTGHVTEDLLVAYFSEELGPETVRKLLQHTSNCEPCRKEFAIIEGLFRGLGNILVAGTAGKNSTALKKALKEQLRENKIFYSIIYLTDYVPTLIACSSKGLVRVMFGSGSEFEFMEKLKAEFPDRWLIESFDEVEPVRRQFEEYFFRKRRDFDFAFDPVLLKSSFQKKVLLTLREIPYGQVVTYGELARRVGKPGASRAVGNALGSNPVPIFLPCHRVVAGKGKLGGFTGGTDIKKKLLALEGVSLHSGADQLDLFNPFNSLS